MSTTLKQGKNIIKVNNNKSNKNKNFEIIVKNQENEWKSRIRSYPKRNTVTQWTTTNMLAQPLATIAQALTLFYPFLISKAKKYKFSLVRNTKISTFAYLEYIA